MPKRFKINLINHLGFRPHCLFQIGGLRIQYRALTHPCCCCSVHGGLLHPYQRSPLLGRTVMDPLIFPQQRSNEMSQWGNTALTLTGHTSVGLVELNIYACVCLSHFFSLRLFEIISEISTEVSRILKSSN